LALVIAFCRIILWLIILDILGIDIGGFTAILAAILFALGFALAGLLQQVVAGLVILNTGRFVKDDVIDHSASGAAGTVQETAMFDTTVLTFDNRMVKIPNYSLLTSAVILPVREPIRRVDFNFGIAYDADIKRAKKIVVHVMDKQHKFLEDPAYTVAVNGHGDNAISIVARGWCKTKHYWDLYFGVMEGVKYAFDKNGIGIPFPQRDVHIYQEQKPAFAGTDEDLQLSDISDYESSSSSESESAKGARKMVNRVTRRKSSKKKDQEKKEKEDKEKEALLEKKKQEKDKPKKK
jgi:small conductance mechanosensitive channel